MKEGYKVPSLPANLTMVQIKNHNERKSRKSKAIVTLVAAVSSEIFIRIMTMKLAFDVWNFLEEYEGDEWIKGMKMVNLIREFELQKMKDRDGERVL
ncbi:hypothetical protein PVK06_030829 [Gossypium arboreum]|uniref:Uncharacterized protein n=1 Tax=Gossypium arboreum TaxID=29729 RepID=A0ABR0NPD2_GOSAR|nr:hypothetical protein PVK06_030829 [Gossypium arboreum]